MSGEQPKYDDLEKRQTASNAVNLYFCRGYTVLRGGWPITMTVGKTDTAEPGWDVDIVALKPSTQIGRFDVLAVLGQGSFGITYRARDPQLGRDVAIKEYLPTSLAVRVDGVTVKPRSTATAEEFRWGRERFLEEARTIAGLHHVSSIVRVFEFLEANGTAYMVMELVRGETLGKRLHRDGRLDFASIEGFFGPLLDGLEQVHETGFLHRDIKPENIVLDDKGHPTLIDFGASRAAMVSRTVAMTAIFTPGYAAAEQFTASKQGPATDIYGLAATLYHAITGRRPPNAIDRIIDDKYEAASRLAPLGFPSAFLAGVDAGLAVRATDRPQSIADWRLILGGTVAGTVVLPRSDRASGSTDQGHQSGRPGTARKSKRAIATVAMISVAVLLGIGAYWVLQPRELIRPSTSDVAVKQRPQPEAEALARRQSEADEAKRNAEVESTERARREQEVVRAQEAQLALEAARQRAEAEAARVRAEAEARVRADAEAATKAKADADAAAAEKVAAEAAAQQKASEAQRKLAEMAEAGLALSTADRQRAQVALTSLGFDTHGTDGIFGQRSRQMITAWQSANGRPQTGFLDRSQQQMLLAQASTALNRFDDEQRRKVEDDKHKAAQTAPIALPAPAALPPPSMSTGSEPLIEQKQVALANKTGTGCDTVASYTFRIYASKVELSFRGAWQPFIADASGSFDRTFKNDPTSNNFRVSGSLRSRTITVTNLGQRGCSWAGTF